MDITQAVLLTTQRSGSTFIRLWLNSHPNVRCHSEVFHRLYYAADGFKHYCESRKFRRWAYHFLGPKKKSTNRYNIALNILVKQFLNELYYNPNFSAPWTDMMR